MRIVIQGIVGQAPEVTGTFVTVTGMTDGSSVITCSALANKRVYVERGNIFNPGINPESGGLWHTKALPDDFITFNTPLANGEFIYIETI